MDRRFEELWKTRTDIMDGLDIIKVYIESNPKLKDERIDELWCLLFYNEPLGHISHRPVTSVIYNWLQNGDLNKPDNEVTFSLLEAHAYFSEYHCCINYTIGVCLRLLMADLLRSEDVVLDWRNRLREELLFWLKLRDYLKSINSELSSKGNEHYRDFAIWDRRDIR